MKRMHAHSRSDWEIPRLDGWIRRLGVGALVALSLALLGLGVALYG